MKSDQALLEAALVGYQAQIAKIEEAMAEIRTRLGGKTNAPASSAPAAKQGGKRVLSAAARRRIALAQKKRWAEYKKRQAASA